MDDNTYKVLIAIVNSAPAIVGGFAAVAASYFSYKSHVTAKVTQQIALKTEQNTNGMKNELVEATKVNSFAAGKLAERLSPGTTQSE